MTDNLLQSMDQSDQIDIDENKNYLEELVGQDKKFKSPEDLAKGKWHADRTIELQNRRMDDLRADYLRLRDENQAKAKLEELIDQIKKQTPSSANTEANSEEERKPAIDLDQIKSLVSNQVREEKLKEQQDRNFSKVQNKLVETYGSNYSNSLNDQLRTLGMSAAQITELAKSAPDAAIRLLGLEAKAQQDTFQAPPRNQQRSDSFSPGAKKRTWSYYQEMRKTQPELYSDRKIANQMIQDAMELGEEFNDGDFYVRGLHEK